MIKSNKTRNCLQKVLDAFSEFSDNSTIHGFRYLGERKRLTIEKIFWIITFLLSIYWCFWLLINIWQKWDQNPVIVSFDEKPKNILDIPFPAITICPSIKVNHKKCNMFNSFLNVMNLTNENLMKMKALYHICDNDMKPESLFPFYHFMFVDKEDGKNIIDVLKNITNSKEIISNLLLGSNLVLECLEYFTEIVTEDGICFTFNILDFEKIFKNDTVHNKYPSIVQNLQTYEIKSNIDLRQNFLSKNYPFYLLGAGKEHGITFDIFSLQKDIEYFCRGVDQGYKFIIHAPNEFPQTTKQSYEIPFDHKSDLVIKPIVTKMDPSIANLEFSRRKCFLRNEKPLQYFHEYTKQNCEMECLTNYTLKLCNCSKFHMPRVNGTQICSTDDIPCTNLARNQQYLSYNTCNCYPTCDSIEYDIEKYDASFYLNKLFNSFKKLHEPEAETTKDVIEFHSSRISIYFKNSQVLSWKRAQLYGWSDFLANCGGLFGLFMGVSVLSIVEIIYYCTIRLCSNFWLKSRNDTDTNDKEMTAKIENSI